MMIHVVLGTKAQLIKMAPVMAGFREQGVPYNFIFTSQHRETVEDLLRNFELPGPDYVLHRGHEDVTSFGRMFIWFLACVHETLRNQAAIFKRDTNGIVLVHGDTFSTLLGALLGRMAGLRVGHVESGLRSFRLLHPFPEEITRILTIKMSNYFFCPGEWALRNLGHERGEKIDIGQNTLLDALARVRDQADHSRVEVPPGPFGVVSIHRTENIFRKRSFVRCIELIEEVAKAYPLVFILHLPTLEQARAFGLLDRIKANPRIDCRPRYDYVDFIGMLDRSHFLITDGGSNQEESSYLGIPCLLLREATERTDGLDANVVLSGYDPQAVREFLHRLEVLRRPVMDRKESPSLKIVEACRRFSRSPGIA